MTKPTSASAIDNRNQKFNVDNQEKGYSEALSYQAPKKKLRKLKTLDF
jgi:hypothetical protein